MYTCVYNNYSFTYIIILYFFLTFVSLYIGKDETEFFYRVIIIKNVSLVFQYIVLMITLGIIIYFYSVVISFLGRHTY